MPENIITEQERILVKGARVNNLKNLDVEIPRDQMIVITGVSGSGKSSLAFDTLYAEGQRRYVESLSSYARQFLGRMNKPEVDYIKGIPPAIAVEQKVNTRNPRSTVGTSTEIYDYLKLLFARIGKTYSPVSGEEVRKNTVTDVIDFIQKLSTNTKYLIASAINLQIGISIEEKLQELAREGFLRVIIKNEVFNLTDAVVQKHLMQAPDELKLVIDRLKVPEVFEDDYLSRLGDSIQMAFEEGDGYCFIFYEDSDSFISKEFSIRFEADGIDFEEPNPHMFSFNNPLGACPVCEGYGKVIGIDMDLVIPDKSKSIYDEAIVCWRGEKMGKWKDKLIMNAAKFDFPVHTPYYELSEEQKMILWNGNRYFKGLSAFFDYLEEKKYKIQYRVMLSRYRGRTTCHACNGTRLKKETRWVKVNQYTIQDLVLMPVAKLQLFFKQLKLDKYQESVSKRILTEINNRLNFLCEVGLGYLTLNRLSSTLSGGESQRINLATSLGSSLVGSLYILDEPSIGLHPRDTQRLIGVLKNLKEIGNTVLVVEHDEDIIKAADQIIDIGPEAGRNGGELIFMDEPARLINNKISLTNQYLTGEKSIKVPQFPRKWNKYIMLKGARENNLKNISVKFPLETLTIVTGVSGSGKTSLIKHTLYPAIGKYINGTGERTGEHDLIEGDLNLLDNVEFVDQNPIGKSSRSNPVTYLKAYDEIRKLYAEQQASKILGFKPAHFSFNVDGGRCEECQGEGVIKVEMQFMADVYLQCEHCNGKRFKDDVLEVSFKGKNIFDLLEMTVNEAIEFFSESKLNVCKKIVDRLKPLQDVGLGYIKLGQSSNSLSGGESQRVKLASFLVKEEEKFHKLFIFDEPTTGLHFHDINKLLVSFNALIEKGNSVIVIEHNLDVIKCADWIIDLGPEGGEEGGRILYEGTPRDMVADCQSYTAIHLREKMK